MAFGEQTWDDGPSASKTKINYKELYQQFPRGTHKVRIVTNPFQFAVHKGIKAVGDAGFGRKVTCSKSSKDDPCPLCEKGFKPQTRYLLGVISRATGTYKIMDINYSTLQDIKTLKNDPDWGDPFTYDLSIIVNPDGGPAGYYTVNPVPAKPLSADDMRIKDNDDIEFLKTQTAAPTYDVVASRLEKILEGAPLQMPEAPAGKAPPASKAAPAKARVVAATKVAPAPVAPAASSDEDDDVFPDYET
jgi:hypothetical protein